MSLPNTYTNKNETGCCAVPNTKDWDEKEVEFKNKKFIRMYTRSVLFVPLNMSKVMTAIAKQAEDADAVMPPQEVMILSRDLSPWKAEQLYAVTKDVEGADSVQLSGSFLTKVFEGSFSDAKKWYDALLAFAKKRGKKSEKVYFFYTTCPKCAKHYGKNYTIGFAEVA